jgi:uncharacterized cupin superfamily protein
VPHAHDAFDEAIYVLEGRLLVWGTGNRSAVMRDVDARHASRLLP